MSLYARVVGPGRPNLAFLHGLFGQGRNWTSVAKELEPVATSILFDLPNHGHSAWTDEVSYEAMADAVARDLRDRMGSAASVTMTGHSMGGKVAMQLALRHPELIRGLIVIDIAPSVRESGSDFMMYCKELAQLPLNSLQSRAEASDAIKDAVPSDRTREFLLSNLRRRDGGWAWQMNLPLLKQELPAIYGFPHVDHSYDGPVLWVRGGKSGYVRDEDFAEMMRLFPRTELLTVPEAGHWVHTDAPETLVEAMRTFLERYNLSRPLPQ